MGLVAYIYYFQMTPVEDIIHSVALFSYSQYWSIFLLGKHRNDVEFRLVPNVVGTPGLSARTPSRLRVGGGGVALAEMCGEPWSGAQRSLQT